MFETLIANWQLIAVAVGLALLVVPRLGGVASAVRGWLPSVGGPAKPSQDDLVHAYRLLFDNLAESQTTKALADHVWPAVGRYRR